MTVVIQGGVKDNGDVRFDEFIEELNATLDSLRRAEFTLAGKQTSYFRVTNLSHKSPATITLEQIPISNKIPVSLETIPFLIKNVRRIKEEGEADPSLDFSTLRAFRNLAMPLGKNVTSITVMNGAEQVEITEALKENIDELTADECENGSMSGVLEEINIHNRVNKFEIYPPVGPSKITCHFPDVLLEEARGALKHYVTVHGTVKTRRREEYPHEIDVVEIDKHGLVEGKSAMWAIRGIASDITGNTPPEEFVRKLRNV